MVTCHRAVIVATELYVELSSYVELDEGEHSPEKVMIGDPYLTLLYAVGRAGQFACGWIREAICR